MVKGERDKLGVWDKHICTITYKRDNKPFVRNVVKVFFTKETLDRDIKFLENYPYYNDRIRNNELTQIAMLKVLKQKAFGDE